MSFLRKWRYLLPAFTIAALMAFVACGDDDGGGEKSPAATGEGEAAPADQQKVVFHSQEPQYFDPHRSNFEQDIAIERMLFRGLYRLQSTDEGGVEAVPAMADGEPEVSADGKTFTVKLKSGLKWSDGKPLTAQHFVDGIVQRGCGPDVSSEYTYLLQSPDVGGIIGVKGCDDYSGALGTETTPKTPTPEELAALRDAVGVKAVDDTTLTIELVNAKLPNSFKQIFSLWKTFPSRIEVIQQFGDKWTDPGNIVGNGPYIMTDFVPKDHVTLKPNPNWALEPKPQLQELTIKFIDDFEAAFRSYQTGELDQARIPEPEVQTAQNDASLKDQLLVVPSGRIWSVEMQMENAVIKDFNVRLALSKAIDRDALSKVVYNGVNQPALYWLVKGIEGHQGSDKFKEIDYDVEGAKKALADAGYANGQGFPKLTITVTNNPPRVAEGEFLQRAWKETLGIDTEIQAVDAKTRSATFNSENFELFPGGWQLDYPDPENPLIGLFNTGGGNNHYNCSDPDIDAKLQAASTEQDNDKRIQLLDEAEDLIITKLCGVAPIWQGALPYLVNPKIGGVKANGTIDAGQPGNWCSECWFVKKQ